MTAWYVLRASTRQETRAVASLAELGLDAYCPNLTRWRRTSRVKTKVQAPLFVGYVFACLTDDDFPTATDAEGVHKILSSAAGPLKINPMIVDALRKAEASGEFDKTRRTKPDPTPGAKVAIVAGKFQGFPAEFVKRRPDERVEVLFQMFGRWSPLTLKAEEIGGMGEEEAA